MHRSLVVGALALVGGIMLLVIGLAFGPTVLAFAASSGADTNIGSFSGVQNLNDLQPLIYYLLLTVSALALMGSGGFVAVRGFKKNQ